MNTKLQQALLDAGLKTLSFTIDRVTFPVAVEDLGDRALLGLLTYGRRKANDTYNSAKAGDKPMTPGEVMARIKEWDFGVTGPRVDSTTKHLREIVTGLLVKTGYKASEAAKLAKVPETGLRLVLVDRLRAAGRHTTAEAEASALLPGNLAKLQAEAARRAAAQPDVPDVDLEG